MLEVELKSVDFVFAFARLIGFQYLEAVASI